MRKKRRAVLGTLYYVVVAVVVLYGKTKTAHCRALLHLKKTKKGVLLVKCVCRECSKRVNGIWGRKGDGIK